MSYTTTINTLQEPFSAPPILTVYPQYLGGPHLLGTGKSSMTNNARRSDLSINTAPPALPQKPSMMRKLSSPFTSTSSRESLAPPQRQRTASTPFIPAAFQAAAFTRLANGAGKGKQLAAKANTWGRKQIAGLSSSTSERLSPTNSRTRSASSPPIGSSSSPGYTTILGVQVPKTAMQESGKVFGKSLSDAVDATRMVSPHQMASDSVGGSSARDQERAEAMAWLPCVAVRCMEYLELHDDEEGLYRVPGSAQQVSQLKTLFDCGMDLDLRTKSTSELDPHAVASLFKAWLRELPGSILTLDLEPILDQLMYSSLGAPATARNNSTHSPAPDRTSQYSLSNPPKHLLQKMSIVLLTLPMERWQLLREIANHLAHLAANSEQNKMTLSNLRLILSPTLHMSPAMLQILVLNRVILFDRESAKALASPQPSPSNSRQASMTSSPVRQSLASSHSSQTHIPFPGRQSIASQYATEQLEHLQTKTPSPTPIAQRFSSHGTPISARYATPPTSPSRSSSHSFIPRRSSENILFANRERRGSISSVNSTSFSSPASRRRKASSTEPTSPPPTCPLPLPPIGTTTPDLSRSSEEDTSEEAEIIEVDAINRVDLLEKKSSIETKKLSLALDQESFEQFLSEDERKFFQS